MGDATFASLLAQVIPGLIIALVLEMRGLHETYQKLASSPLKPTRTARGGGIPPAPFAVGRAAMVTLAVQCLYLAVLILLELSALIAAFYEDPGVAASVVHPEVSLPFIAGGFVLTLVFSVLGTNRLYQHAGVISDDQRRGFHWVLRIAALLIVMGTVILLHQAS